MLEWIPAVGATALLGVGAIAIWIAALMPQFYPVWWNRDALGTVGRHVVLWRVNSALFLVSAVATLVGCALAFPIQGSPLTAPALLVLTVATALWSIDLGLRLSVIVAVASERSPDAEAWLARAQSWSNAIWYIAAGLMVLAFAGLGVVVLTTGVLAAWVGWVCLASAVLSSVVFVVTRDAPPIVIYAPVLPLAVAALVAALEGAPTA